MSPRVESARSTLLFVATEDGEAAQVLAVELAEPAPGQTVDVSTDGAVVGSATAGDGVHVEVPLAGIRGRAAGERVPVTVGGLDVEVVVGEPGWTVWMISHFHYDPVWWNTQAAYTATWDELGEEAQRTRAAFQQTGFTLVAEHLATARRDPDYTFVLAEVDYLKPYWDAHPEDRDYLRRLLAEGRVEIMGGTYNEPNTNLTTAETTARNFVHGVGFQREVLGGDPHTAWQLDVFGHDPQFPGLAAEAGLTSSSWARGPFHQWGPMLTSPDPSEGWGDPSVMQFPAEFEWISPSGRGVLTHYMPAHYSAGWTIDSKTTLAEAETSVYELFELLSRVAATRNVLLPVGTDYTPPSKWVTEIHRDWNARYVSPRMVSGLPREFFAAVRAELAEDGRSAVPQTRDMNPIYTGKDVSYIDTKQAQRRAESLLVDAEKFATLAALSGQSYPHAAFDKAWRQLAYGAHHDAITGSEADQVYLDLLTTWRDAHDIAAAGLRASLDHLARRLDAPADAVAVFNPSNWSRTDRVSVPVVVEAPATHGLRVLGPTGAEVAAVVENVTRHDDGGIASADVTFVADAPGSGYDARWRIVASDTVATGWAEVDSSTSIDNGLFRVVVDPARGGAVSELTDLRSGRSVLRPGGLGHVLVVEQEYPEHPTYHEGPWHLVPSGSAVTSASVTAAVRAERSALGSRLVVSGSLAGIDYRQTITLWDGDDRIDSTTTLHGFTGADQLVRLRWDADVPGGLPVSEVGDAVVGRGFALIGRGDEPVDSAEHPWTLDNPANGFVALSSTVRVRVDAGTGAPHQRAIGVAELVAADASAAPALRELAAALAGQGVTSTTSTGAGARYGTLRVDSNLPDTRVAIGGPADNPFVAAVFDAADEQYRIEFDKQLAEHGSARLWVPAARPLREVWRPSAVLTDVRDLPVLVVAGDGALAALVADLEGAAVDVAQSVDASTPGEPSLDDYTVAVVNTGMPSFAVQPDGTLNLSVMRSCTGWPSGVWIDPPRRTMPDGSNFQQQHWTHTFEYSLVAGPGDWRRTRLVQVAHDVNHPLLSARPDATGSEPVSGRYLELEGTADVVLTALKPHGNPIAQGRRPGPVEAVTLRWYEPSGSRGSVEVRSDLFGAVESLDLLERPTGRDATALTPMQIATVGAAVTPAHPPTTEPPVADAEPHTPVYTRYWLNNTGPAPRGNVVVPVHVEPAVLDAGAGDTVDLVVSVASDRTETIAEGEVSLVLPDGWTAEPDVLAYALAPGDHARTTVRVTLPTETVDGVHHLAVRTDVDGVAYQDVCRVHVGTVGAPEFEVTVTPAAVELSPGGTSTIEVAVTSAIRTELWAQVQLVSPWHTWDLLPQWDSGVTVSPGGTEHLAFPVVVPTGTQPGTWWALVKVAAAGRLFYSEPVTVSVVP